MPADLPRIGMGRDERRIGEACHLPKTFLVQVREVEHDLEAVAGAHQLEAAVGEAGACVRRRGIAERHAVAEDVGAAPDGADGA